ncbi:hypothetical protein NW759_008815 [Fusarium solani]|nr:hypothetical protein NW759_008815 [Fusarium solani]
MDYQREWQYNAESPACGDYFESICCPCIVYGRANLRLKIASDERDGRDITERQVRLLSSNCCMFASCLPFYGCFISAIRGQVRDFYDIQGDKSRDLAVSCCCPSETLIQTENEILLRQARSRKASGASSSTGYIPPSPMTYSSSSSSTSQTTTPNTECDEPLPCIPEECSTTTPSSMSSRRTSASRRRERSIARDPVAPTDATLVSAHELSQDPATPAMYKGHSAPHRLSKDPASLTHPPPTHHLRDDTKAQVTSPRTDTRPSRHRGHGSSHDQVDSFRPRRASDTGHDLHHDPTTRVKSPSPTAHSLQDDANPSPRRSPPSNAHHLQHDAVNSRAKSPRPHALEADESVPSRSAGPGPHHLQHDK